MNQIKTKRTDASRKEIKSSSIQKYELIKKAAENPKYTFRTLDGLIGEAHVSLADVYQTIEQHPEEFVILFRKGKNGQRLITTRKHYKEKASMGERIMGAVLNRVY